MDRYFLCETTGGSRISFVCGEQMETEIHLKKHDLFPPVTDHRVMHNI